MTTAPAAGDRLGAAGAGLIVAVQMHSRTVGPVGVTGVWRHQRASLLPEHPGFWVIMNRATING